jgi:hypothetical protein
MDALPEQNPGTRTEKGCTEEETRKSIFDEVHDRGPLGVVSPADRL